MLLRNHYYKVLLELSMFFGILVLGTVVYSQLGGLVSVSLKALWAIALLVATIGFRMESFINIHQLSEHTMRMNYLISSTLSDIALIVLLFYFTPGGKQFEGKGWMLLGIYVVLKAAFYTAMHLQSKHNANKINKVLQEKSLQ